MCVLIVHLRQVPGYPIVVGANRDEHFDRPSAPPALDPSGRILAPTDLRAGGTWLGLNRAGVFVALTNRSRVPAAPDRASRGGLCLEALGAADATAAVARVEAAVRAAPRNGFNLLVAGGRRGFVLTGAATSVERRALAAGTHVLTNDHELDAFDPGDVSPAPAIADTLARLAAVCRDHADHDGTRICKHHGDRGTVSSALVAIGADAGHPTIFRFADGPPCRTPYRDVGASIADWTT